MAGGRGERLGYVEKPLLEICGRVILESLVNVGERVADELYVAVSPHSPRTRTWCMERGINLLETPGQGYSIDLRGVVKTLGRPLLVLPADMPFMSVQVLREFTRDALQMEASLVTLVVDRRRCFPKSLERVAGPVGVSLFKQGTSGWANLAMCKFPELLDIDTPLELEYARRLCLEVSRW